MQKIAIILAAYLSVTSHARSDESIGRYQMIGPGPIVVIDTVTGQLWTVFGSAPNYYMRRICYAEENGQLKMTPYEDTFPPEARNLCRSAN